MADLERERIGDLEARCRDLEARLLLSDEKLHERGSRLYELERQYASEHFALQESMRELKTERMRNAGAFGEREIILRRAKELQGRIAGLKARLRKYEDVEDALFDGAPIVAETS